MKPSNLPLKNHSPILGLDQYVAVVYPLEYNQKVTRGMSVKLITLVWTAGFLASTVSASQLASHRSPWASCRLAKIDFFQNQTYLWLCHTISGLFFFIPVLILTGIYLRIFAAASKSSRDIRRNSFHLPLPLTSKDPFLDQVPTSGSAPDLLSPIQDESQELQEPPDDLKTASEIPTPRRRAPKLSALRNNATFSKTISSLDHPGDQVLNRQMSHQDRRVMMTPKRKCSFSSFSECRYVADGGKTRTFLISIEAASPTGMEFKSHQRHFHFSNGLKFSILTSKTSESKNSTSPHQNN